MTTIISFNIANAMVDEKSPMRFGTRMNKIAEQIKKINPDVVCLQEIRQCLNPEGTEIMSGDKICYELAQLTNLSIGNIFSLNPSELAFKRLTLYNSKTVFPLQNHNEWCSETPHILSGCVEKERRKYGLGVQYMKFSPVIDAEGAELADEIKHFWIANIHYPLGFKDKMSVNKYLKNRVPTLCDNSPVIICGDFNTFMDDGGTEQLEDLQTVFSNQSTKIEHTFTTFPHDSFVVKTGNIMSSKLDHIFTYPQTFNVNVSCLSTLESRISDHYIMVVDF